MATIKDRIRETVTRLEQAQKAEKAAEASRRFNETMAGLAKTGREINRQKSEKQ